MANWSDLPLDLLELISNQTNTSSSDTRHFRAVCSLWRDSIPPKGPTFFHSPIIKFSPSQTQHFEVRLVKRTAFVLSPPFDHPDFCWVVKVEEQMPEVFRLLDLFSKETYVKEYNYNVLNLININTLELGHEYVLLNNNDSENDHMSSSDMEQEKVAFTLSDENGDFTLLLTDNSTGKLLMYKSYSQEWAFLDSFALGYDDWSLPYVDVVEYEGRFYAVTDSGRTVSIDCSDESSVTVNLTVKSIIGGDKKFLVKSDVDLLLVDVYTCPDKGLLGVNAIDVYKLDMEVKKWVLLTSLGGRTIFLSKNSSFCGSNLHGFKENCIYFSFKNNGKEFSDKKSGHLDNIVDYYDENKVNEIGVFDYDKENFGSFGGFEDSKFFCWPPPLWVNLLH